MAQLKNQSPDMSRKWLNEWRHVEHAKKALAELRLHTQAIEAEAARTCSTKQELERWLDDARDEIKQLWKKNHSLGMWVAHVPAQKAVAVKHALTKSQAKISSVKEKGIIKDTFRDLVRELVADGVGVEHGDPIMKCVSQAVGVELKGDISTQSVSRIVLEGGVASKMQIVDHVQRSSRGRTRLFLGVHSAVNHTSKTQLCGLQIQLENLYPTYNSSMQGNTKKADQREFAVKLTGVNTDHAADQKRLAQLLRQWKTCCEREIRGEKSLLGMAPEALLPLLFEATEQAVAAAGGPAGWDALPEAEKGTRNAQTYKGICEELGNVVFEQLTDTKKQAIDWIMDHGVPGPIKLMNQDNAAATHGGAIKATSLAGAVFCHKDDKKGQQDSLKYFFEDTLGYPISFPDTSNTRYQSHCEAASELLVHLELYIQFLDIVKDKKDSRSLNHMEQNVHAALKDSPTLHELCVLALFSQSENTNVLNMGPLHLEIHTFMEKIINNPDILLSPAATYTTTSFDRNPWDRPEAIYAIQQLAPTLPHLKGVVVAFFEGASETWKHFMEEYKPGGQIASASPELRKSAWMPTTNDVNKGALGSYQVAMRCYPNISQHQFNARTCYKRNHTSSYIQASLKGPDRKYLRQQARNLDGQILEKKAKASKVAAVIPVMDVNQLLQGHFTNAELDLQLDWHRQFCEDLPRKKDVLTKALKTQALQHAIMNLLAHQQMQMDPRTSMKDAGAETELYESSDEE
ncbi:hypothetical protein K439DRAFT_1610258 [Ramaria rubella]|nr:hypothetical protein K439DRAFT_1610258 [Ramaria rubella]